MLMGLGTDGDRVTESVCVCGGREREREMRVCRWKWAGMWSGKIGEEGNYANQYGWG